MVHRARRTQSETLVRYLIDPWRFAVRMKQKVGVALHQSRHECHARQIDNVCVGGIDAGSRSSRFDPVSPHPDGPSRMGGSAVEYPRRTQHGCRFVLRQYRKRKKKCRCKTERVAHSAVHPDEYRAHLSAPCLANNGCV
jgi:hypothetical protein